jgi:hypothetical protein
MRKFTISINDMTVSLVCATYVEFITHLVARGILDRTIPFSIIKFVFEAKPAKVQTLDLLQGSTGSWHVELRVEAMP